MGKSNGQRVARQLQNRFDIPYTQALQTFFDTRHLPGYKAQVQAHRDAGKSAVEAQTAVCIDNWEFE